MLKRIEGKWAFSTYDPISGLTLSYFIYPYFDVELFKEAAKIERVEYVFSFLNPEE